MPEAGVFPTRENCDPTDPAEAFLWMFVAPPGVRGASLMLPIGYYRLMSERLWQLGARPVEEPTLEWVPPSANDPNWLTSPGSWVPAGTAPKPTEAEQARAAMARMSGQQKLELLTVLSAGEPYPDSPSGRVAESLSKEQRAVVLAALREDSQR